MEKFERHLGPLIEALGDLTREFLRRAATSARSSANQPFFGFTSVAGLRAFASEKSEKVLLT